MAVMKSLVPATLKSISPSASGAAVTQQLFNDGTVNVVAQAIASAPAVEGPDGTAADGAGLAADAAAAAGPAGDAPVGGGAGHEPVTAAPDPTRS